MPTTNGAGRVAVGFLVTSSPVSLNSYPGQPSDAIQIKEITISPDPPQPGKDMTVKVNGEAQSVIEVVTTCFLCNEFSFMMSARMVPT